MSDKPIALFEKQKRVYPRDIWGRFRRMKWIATSILLFVYFFSPFLRWDRGPNAPDQAILIDMPARRAYFFFIEVWPQEIFYITGLLTLAAIGLFFVTSLFGRVWCGYTCPQTVWTDLFVKVEHLFQGDRNARIKLDESPLSFDKIWRKAATHAVWLVISFLTGGAWVLYFADAPTLLRDAVQGDVSYAVMMWVLGLTASTYIMAGYARDQVCAYMCPYARFQSAMFDKDTLIIGYDAERGEPRRSHKQGESWDGRGHCIDCKQCVAVCPTGIDIRDGLQMECIACGLCVDACDSVMDKIGLPRGLVRYDTERDLEARSAAKAQGLPYTQHFRIFRPRFFYYSFVILVVGGAMLTALIHRTHFDLHVLHERNPLYVKLSSGDVRNGYDIKILNKTHDPRTYALSIEGIPQDHISVEGVGHPDATRLTVAPDSVEEFHVFVNEPESDLHDARKNLEFVLTDNQEGVSEEVETMFVSGDD